MEEWPLSYWYDVVFSDECRFSLKYDSGVFEYGEQWKKLKIQIFSN